MSDGLRGEDPRSSPNIEKHRVGRDAVRVEAQTAGDITTGPEINLDTRPTVQTTVVNRDNSTTTVLLVVLVAIFGVAVGVATWQIAWPIDAPGALSSPEAITLDKEPERIQDEVPPLSMLPTIAGKTWVAVVKGPDYSWDGPSSRTLLQQLQAEHGSRSFSLVPSAIRSRLELLMTADPEVAPGGGQAPEGTESLYALLMDAKDQNLAGPTDAVSLSCEASVVSFREAEVVFQSVSNHTGQGPTPSGALDMALKRCLADFDYPG